MISFNASQQLKIAPFAEPVMKHMNEDHADSTVAMVKHFAGVPCSEALIVSMDSLGMTVLYAMILLVRESLCNPG